MKGMKGILLLAFLLRMATALSFAAATGPQSLRSPDTASYVDSAASLLGTGRFERHGNPEVVRTPGYPLFLLPGMALGWGEAAAIPLQAALGTATAWIVFLLGRTLSGSSRAGTWGALFFALEPLSILYSSKLLTETLFTFFAALFFLLFARFLAEGRLSDCTAALLSLTASAFVRPISCFLPTVLATFIPGAALFGKISWRRSGAALALLAVLCLLPLFLWTERNRRLAGYDGFSGISAVNMYFYNAAAVRAKILGAPYLAVQRNMGYLNPGAYFREHPEQREWRRGEVLNFQKREGTRILLEHPGTYLKIHLTGMVRVLFGPCAEEFFSGWGIIRKDELLRRGDAGSGLFARTLLLGREHPLFLLLNVLLGLLLAVQYALGATGLLSAARKRGNSAPLAFLLAAFAYFILLSGGPAGYSRFRLPAAPLTAAFSGMGAALLAPRLREAWKNGGNGDGTRA